MTDHPGPSRHDLQLPAIRVAAWRWSPPAGTPPLGRQLVILHGVTASSRAFDEVAAEIASDGWTVDALDLPGHGATRWLGPDGEPLSDQESVGPEAYDLSRVGELAAAAIRELPPAVPASIASRDASPLAPAGSPVLLGHSWGAGVAVMAVDAGLPVERLVLLDPPFLTPEQGAEMAEGFRSELRAGAVGGGAGDDGPGIHPPADTSPLAADAIARGAPWDPVALLAGWRARHQDLRVDVIAGDPSVGGLIPAAMLPVLRAVLGREHVHELPGLGHSPHREDPARFLEVLRRAIG